MDDNSTVPRNLSSSEEEYEESRRLQRRSRMDSKPHSRTRHKGQERSRLYSSSASRSSSSNSSSSSGSRDRVRKKRRSSKHDSTRKSKERTKHRKRKREPSSDSSDSSFSFSSSSSELDSSSSPVRKKKKKHSKAKEKHKRKKTSVKHTAKSSTHKKEKKRRKYKAKDAIKTKRKKAKLKSQKMQKEPAGTEPRVELPSALTATLSEKGTNNQIKGIKAAIAETTGKRRGPMTREEYEKQQSVVRRVFDPDTGRHRLVKGDGEIIEEIVSRERQKAINKQATLGDGASFQAGIAKLL